LAYLSVEVGSGLPVCRTGSAYLSVELECGCAQVHQAEEQRKVEQDARTLYIRFNKTYPSSHDEIKVRES
jgi:hypothetical protein